MVDGLLPFNLWTDPWIGVVSAAGYARLGIADCLVRAHQLDGLCESSPLVSLGMHRLLTAILQACYAPEDRAAVAAIIEAGQFDPERIARFGERYAHRFNLFDGEPPFLQSADIPQDVRPDKGDATLKSVAYLFAEEPVGDSHVFFTRHFADAHALCPACAAGGLVVFPSVALRRGAGYRAAIGGMACFVLPVGATLAETLARSIIAPEHQPSARSAVDVPEWERHPVVPQGQLVQTAGYIESLTMPTRRVRLLPAHDPGTCTRCGEVSATRVCQMVFTFGRAYTGPFWRDPFVAYSGNAADALRPIGARPGRALWREFGTMFLGTAAPRRAGLAPAVVEQYAAIAPPDSHGATLTWRCVGLQAHPVEVAKILAWTDETLAVPVGLLADPEGAAHIQRGLEWAEQWAADIAAIANGGNGARRMRDDIRARMMERYWTGLADAFRTLVLDVAGADRDAAMHAWGTAVLRGGAAALDAALPMDLGARGTGLLAQAATLARARARFGKRQRAWGLVAPAPTDATPRRAAGRRVKTIR